MSIEIFEKDGREYRIRIYEGFANWYAVDEDGDPEDALAEGWASRECWNELVKKGYRWIRTEK